MSFLGLHTQKHLATPDKNKLVQLENGKWVNLRPRYAYRKIKATATTPETTQVIPPATQEEMRELIAKNKGWASQIGEFKTKNIAEMNRKLYEEAIKSAPKTPLEKSNT